jgi:hypothetical protein
LDGVVTTHPVFNTQTKASLVSTHFADLRRDQHDGEEKGPFKVTLGKLWPPGVSQGWNPTGENRIERTQGPRMDLGSPS